MRNPLSDKIVSIPPSGIRKFFDIVNEMKKRVITMKKGVVISDEEKGGYIDED